MGPRLLSSGARNKPDALMLPPTAVDRPPPQNGHLGFLYSAAAVRCRSKAALEKADQVMGPERPTHIHNPDVAALVYAVEKM